MTSFEAAAHHYNQLYADDDLDQYEPHKRERMLIESYKVQERKFENLVKELHMPFLDCKLYRKYFIATKNEQNLTNLLSIVDTLSEHKNSTLLLLKFIFEREQIVNVIKVMAYDYAKGKLSTLEVQTKVLQLLYSHQRITLKIVEAIQEWRSRLTRPYAFEWRGINYIFKIIKDCQFIDTCDLNAILPLQLSSYPLCSNLNSLNLFGPQTIANGGQQQGITITYPMKVSKKTMMPAITQEFQLRLQRAEVVIFSEHNLQINLMKELVAINSAGAFLTIMDVKHVVPNCCDGIRLNNKDWDKRLHTALHTNLKKLQSKIQTMQRAPPRDDASYTDSEAAVSQVLSRAADDQITSPEASNAATADQVQPMEESRHGDYGSFDTEATQSQDVGSVSARSHASDH
mmetsp:Transcript_8037/g.14327  ORF Transcript_8037/g.14327 Transcript_8037/m.14327 type:complete len:401 (-) Transcript_8037:85-1287(-)